MCHFKYGSQAVLAMAIASLSYGCNTEISVGRVPEGSELRRPRPVLAGPTAVWGATGSPR